MATTFRPCEPDRMLLLAPYEGDGRRNAPYEPRMMVKVLLYGDATGVFSSRAMARKLEEDVAFRVLGAGHFPSHRTLCEFRRRHLGEFKGRFVEVVRVARELGLARFGKLSMDGTKVRANASKRKAMSYGRMREEARRLAGEVEALSNRARDTDAEEDALWGVVARRRATGGVAPSRGPVGGDCCGEEPAPAKAGERLESAQRRWLSGAPKGWVKEVLGFRRFSVRGRDKARGEWDLVCPALNVKRLRPLLAV